MIDHTDDTSSAIQESRLWSDGRWMARVIKNEDDDGWAVSMTLRGEDEPALVGPWTMGRPCAPSYHPVGTQGCNACSVQPQLFQHFIGVLAQRRWGVAQHGRVG